MPVALKVWSLRATASPSPRNLLEVQTLGLPTSDLNLKLWGLLLVICNQKALQAILMLGDISEEPQVFLFPRARNSREDEGS